jgi:MFS family permease
MEEETPKCNNTLLNPAGQITNTDLKKSFIGRNYYSQFMEKIGFTKQTSIVFTIASLIQIMWGCEACFISIYIQSLGDEQEISQIIISSSICILYCMMGLGSFIMGFLTNYLGRIKSIIISVSLYFLSLTACSIIHNYFYIILLRCIANICIGINNLLTLNLLSEYLPTKNRCFILMQYSAFYNIGNLYCIMLKFFFESEDHHHFSHFAWKISNQLSCITGIFAIFIVIFFVKESPLFLLIKNRDEEAFHIIGIMAESKKIEFGEQQKRKIRESISGKKTANLQSKFTELFTKDYILLTILNLFISIICYTNMIAISYLVPKTINELKQTETFTENQQLLIYGIIQLPNGIVGGYLSENKYMGRVRTVYINSILCGVFYLLVYVFPEYLCFFSGVIMFFNSIAFGVAYIYVSESFPTKLRDQSQSFIQFLTFLIGSFSPMLIDNVNKGQAINHFIYFGISCFVCAVFAIFLPFDTIGRPLDDESEENSTFCTLPK